MDEILHIKNLSKRYGDTNVLKNINISVKKGEVVVIIGPSGCGKSTLLRCLNGLEEIQEGEVLLDDQVVNPNKKNLSKNREKIGMVFQSYDLFPHLTILQNVTLAPIKVKKRNRREVEKEALELLERVGLKSKKDDYPRQLSGGQKKRVALARTLVNPSDVLILDEPTNHLDNEMVTWLEDYLNRFKGVVIMVTHDRYFLDKVTNKILEISHGKVYSYDANYSGFLELKAQREEMEMASERKRQSILRMEIEWAKRGCRARSTKQRARLERLEALKNGKAPVQEADVQMDSVETRMGKKTVELHHISKSYGDKVILDDFD